MIIVGCILILVSVALLVGVRSIRGKIELMEGTERTPVSFLQELATSMAEGIGAGATRYRCEISGRVVSSQPLRSELGGVECAYYAMTVTRHYEERYYEEDERGYEIEKRRTGSDIIASKREFALFAVDDTTGTITIRPDGAELVTETSLSRLEDASPGMVIKMGNYVLNVPPNLVTGNRRTTGYRFEEQVIPIGKTVYILGEASDKDGEICMQHPEDGDKYIISLKSEEELLRQAKKSMKWMAIGSAISVASGLALILYGLLL